MKNKTMRIFIIFIAFILLNSIGFSNPFASKKPITSQSENQNTLETLSYKGYALINNLLYAFIQVGERQYMIKAGDSIDHIHLLHVGRNQVALEYKQKSLKLNLEKGP